MKNTLPSVEIYQRVDKVAKKGWGNIQVIGRGTEYERRNGTFKSHYGVVEIYDEPRFSSFSFIYQGKSYYKAISNKKKQFTDLALIRIAGKFMREVVAQEFKPTK